MAYSQSDCISLAICFNVFILKLYIKMNRFIKMENTTFLDDSHNFKWKTYFFSCSYIIFYSYLLLLLLLYAFSEWINAISKTVSSLFIISI